MTDAGQALLQTALDDDADYAFGLTLQDGEVLYLQGKVMSFTTEVGGADTIVSGSVMIGINSDIVSVAP